jgi:hypothetical protein
MLNYFVNKKKSANIAPETHEYNPISAQEALNRSNANRLLKDSTHSDNLQKIIIPSIWKRIHQAIEKGENFCQFKDNDFRPRLNYSDSVFLKTFFTDARYHYVVHIDDGGYRINGLKITGPFLWVTISW